MMASHPGVNRSSVPSRDPEPELRLLLVLAPRGFFSNVGYVLFRRVPGWKRSPAGIWHDVFVPGGLPWFRVGESLTLHILAVVALVTVTNAIAMLIPRVPQVRLRNEIYHYDLSYYLPPLDTGSPPAPKPRKGQPLLAKQKIISLPERPDNFEQTIISPVDVKLPANIKMPNVVAWTERPGVPSSAVERNLSQLTVPALPTDIIAPAPDPIHRDLSQIRTPGIESKIIEPPPSADGLSSNRKLDVATNVIEPPPEARLNPRAITAPAPSVIEPPPSANVTTNMGSMNVGHLSAAVAAPKIEVPEQKVITLQPGGAVARGGAGRSSGGSGPAAPPIAPVGGINAGPNSGQLIALNLHPAVPNGPVVVPPGRRTGEFAAGPEGTANAPGTPDIKAGGNGPGGSGKESAGAGKGGSNGLPPGITVGDTPGAPPKGSVVVAGDPRTQPQEANKNKDTGTLVASARPPRVGETPHSAAATMNAPTRRIEERVFAGKQTYTLSLNTPNLTSSGGSWVIRFAQLQDDHIQAPLSAPVATRTVDPAYPADLIRDGYEGTVVLYAVIHSDGTVGEVKVLRGLQERLDENAKVALSRWKFRPGTKNGQAVDLEAVVQIPFRAPRNAY